MENSTDAWSRGHRDNRARHRFWAREIIGLSFGSRFPDPSLLHDLFSQVRHPNLLRSPYLYPSLNDRSNIISMDMTIPEPISANYND